MGFLTLGASFQVCPHPFPSGEIFLRFFFRKQKSLDGDGFAMI